MGFDFKKTKQGKSHVMILASCDAKDCNKQKYVRKSWATGKMKTNGVYYCKSCSSKKNVKNVGTKAGEKARAMDKIIRDFNELCETIFVNLYDDKSIGWIANQLNSDEMHFISLARDFVADFINDNIPDSVYDCAKHIEENAPEELMELFDWETELKAHALLHIEVLPVPDGI